MIDDLPSTEIVTNIILTAAGTQMWGERDGLGRLWTRHTACGWYEEQKAMAPLLKALVDHREVCQR